MEDVTIPGEAYAAAAKTPPHQSNQTYARLASSHSVAARARVLAREGIRRMDAARAIGYDGLLLEMRFLEDDINRVSGLAGQQERQQLAAGLDLLSR